MQIKFGNITYGNDNGEVRSKIIEELVNSKILPPIKFKTHGKQIINIINNNKYIFCRR